MGGSKNIKNKWRYDLRVGFWPKKIVRHAKRELKRNAFLLKNSNFFLQVINEFFQFAKKTKCILFKILVLLREVCFWEGGSNRRVNANSLSVIYDFHLLSTVSCILVCARGDWKVDYHGCLRKTITLQSVLLCSSLNFYGRVEGY